MAKWTEDEIAQLRNYYVDKKPQALLTIDRTERAIKAQAQLLGLLKPKEIPCTTGELAIMLGVSKEMVIGWRKRRWLRGYTTRHLYTFLCEHAADIPQPPGGVDLVW